MYTIVKKKRIGHYLHLTSSCGKVKTVERWAEICGRSVEKIRQDSASKALPSDQIVRAPLKKVSELKMWRGEEDGKRPHLIIDKIEARKPTGRKAWFYLCDTGYYYDINALADCAEIKPSSVRNRITKYGFTSDRVLREFIKRGYSFRGKRGASNHGENGTAEWRRLGNQPRR